MTVTPQSPCRMSTQCCAVKTSVVERATPVQYASPWMMGITAAWMLSIEPFWSFRLDPACGFAQLTMLATNKLAMPKLEDGSDASIGPLDDLY